MFDILKVVILGAVEGLTEFLPISSTGHLILVNEWISFDKDFTRLFDIVIQLGAIGAVVVHFWSRLMPFRRGVAADECARMLDMWKKILVAVVPALVLGAAAGSVVEEKLFTPWVVAGALIVGGVALVAIEKTKRGEPSRTSIAAIDYKTAFLIGLAQCLALIPGTSRSAATIVGALLLGVSRVVAAEFSFFLAVPTMLAATAYSLLKHHASVSTYEAGLLAVGFIASLAVAWGAIRLFFGYIQRKNFIPFGWYRIALGVAVIGYFLLAK